MNVLDTQDLPIKEPLPGWEGRFFHSQSLTFGYYDIAPDSSIHEHSHPNEEIWHIIEGQVEVTIDGDTQRAGPGFVAIVPPDTTHSVRAVTAARVIVVDYPRRDSIGRVRITDEGDA